jgi:hypothetical protein
MRLRQGETMMEFKERIIKEVGQGRMPADRALTCYERAYFVVSKRWDKIADQSVLVYH